MTDKPEPTEAPRVVYGHVAIPHPTPNAGRDDGRTPTETPAAADPEAAEIPGPVEQTPGGKPTGSNDSAKG